MLCIAEQVDAVLKPDAEGHFDTNLLQVDEIQYLGKSVPDVNIMTDSGVSTLSDLMADKPTILLLSYFTCDHSCPATIQNLSRTAIDAPDTDYRVIVLSFDEKDNLMTMNHVKSSLEETPANWTFGLLKAEESEQLTQSVGFKFFLSEQDQIFVHPAVLIFLSPERKVMRYLFSSEPRGQDIELALIESRNRAPRINEFVDMVKLTCFQYDKSRSRYSLHPTIIFGGAGFGVLALVGLVVLAKKK